MGYNKLSEYDDRMLDSPTLLRLAIDQQQPINTIARITHAYKSYPSMLNVLDLHRGRLRPCLHIAIKARRMDVVAKLVEAGASVSQRSGPNHPPGAAESQIDKFCDCITTSDAALVCRNALDMVCEAGEADIAEMMFHRGAQVRKIQTAQYLKAIGIKLTEFAINYWSLLGDVPYPESVAQRIWMVQGAECADVIQALGIHPEDPYEDRKVRMISEFGA
ncbi:hypothetical protein F5Y18DRAFT_138803 [Xylariaceae sp. FL1019]|nr:hypothetical protein F5Y18DRAFT_138803 [Xylariaceae sp. FL1019]